MRIEVLREIKVFEGHALAAGMRFDVTEPMTHGVLISFMGRKVLLNNLTHPHDYKVIEEEGDPEFLERRAFLRKALSEGK